LLTIVVFIISAACHLLAIGVLGHKATNKLMMTDGSVVFFV